MRLTFRKSFEFDTVLSSEKIFVGGQKFISMQKRTTVCVNFNFYFFYLCKCNVMLSVKVIVKVIGTRNSNNN